MGTCSALFCIWCNIITHFDCFTYIQICIIYIQSTHSLHTYNPISNGCCLVAAKQKSITHWHSLAGWKTNGKLDSIGLNIILCSMQSHSTHITIRRFSFPLLHIFPFLLFFARFFWTDCLLFYLVLYYVCECMGI